MSRIASTESVSPLHTQRLDIRCNVGDAIVANLALHVVFFFQHELDTVRLANAFATALTSLPVFAGRMTTVGGRMHIRCDGRSVPFTSVSSHRTLAEAIRSTSQDAGLWLVDPVNGVTARWGLGPVCRVRVTHLSDGATAIGFSWHHAVGDMQTAMHFMTAWAAAAADRPLAEPLIVEDRAAYLDERLPADGARKAGVRCLGLAELARSALYMVKDARRQRTLSLYFGDDEITRMRAAYETETHSAPALRLTANDVVCAHVCEALMTVYPDVDRRTLAIAVNARSRCGLDPMLVGNIITTLNVDLRRGEDASSIARRIRHGVNHFADAHCDLRSNQEFFDSVGAWRAARCVSTAFNPARWNPLITKLSGFGVYRLRFDGSAPCFYTLLMKLPVAGLGALVDGADGRGLLLQMALPPDAFDAMSGRAMAEHLHRFRRVTDDIPRLHREVHG